MLLPVVLAEDGLQEDPDMLVVIKSLLAEGGHGEDHIPGNTGAICRGRGLPPILAKGRI